MGAKTLRLLDLAIILFFSFFFYFFLIGGGPWRSATAKSAASPSFGRQTSPSIKGENIIRVASTATVVTRTSRVPKALSITRRSSTVTLATTRTSLKSAKSVKSHLRTAVFGSKINHFTKTASFAVVAAPNLAKGNSSLTQTLRIAPIVTPTHLRNDALWIAAISQSPLDLSTLKSRPTSTTRIAFAAATATKLSRINPSSRTKTETFAPIVPTIESSTARNVTTEN